jgi:hypothetical protein
MDRPVHGSEKVARLLTPEGGQVSGVYLVTNPDKLSGIRRDEDAPPVGESGSGPSSG